MTFLTDSNGNIIKDGKSIFFSIDEFAENIAGNHDRCFICGDSRSIKPFNGEHILPDWVLRKFKLQTKKIILPNFSEFTYGGYLIPCCKDCNSEMGIFFEEPISDAFSRGHQGIADFANSSELNLSKLFVWMCLIYVKTHLKDATLLLERNLSKSNGKPISDIYEMRDLHHAYCLARRAYTKATWNPPIMGSMIILPALAPDKIEKFDYIDWTHTSSAMIRIEDVAIIAIFNDCGAVLGKVAPIIESIKGPLSPIQLREVYANFAYFSSLIEDRPVFTSVTNGEEYIINTEMDKTCKFGKYNDKDFGLHMYSACHDLILKSDPKAAEVEKEIKRGGYTYLVNSDGSFLDHTSVFETD
ncbi:MAG: hypothetical protein WC635_12435 [Bacteriovorax sp.]|jgi:hypothetical protein